MEMLTWPSSIVTGFTCQRQMHIEKSESSEKSQRNVTVVFCTKKKTEPKKKSVHTMPRTTKHWGRDSKLTGGS